MKAKRLDEILEECLSAYADGRRSLEESFLLYPGLRAELEPLLRTAAGVSRTLQSYAPPAAVQERGRQRFLSDARARRQVRAMAGGSPSPGWLSGLFGRYRLSFAAGAVALALIAVAVSIAALTGGGADDGATAINPQPAPDQRDGSDTPFVLTNLQSQIDLIQRRLLREERVGPEHIERLVAAAKELTTAQDEIAAVKHLVGEALNNANNLVIRIAESQPEEAEEAQQASDTIRNVAGVIDVPLPAATVKPVDETPSATEPPAPTPTDEPVPTEAPTPVPTDTPVPPTEPPPTETPGVRPVNPVPGF